MPKLLPNNSDAWNHLQAEEEDEQAPNTSPTNTIGYKVHDPIVILLESTGRVPLETRQALFFEPSSRYSSHCIFPFRLYQWVRRCSRKKCRYAFSVMNELGDTFQANAKKKQYNSFCILQFHTISKETVAVPLLSCACLLITVDNYQSSDGISSCDFEFEHFGGRRRFL